MFFQSEYIYIYYFILFYIRRAISTQTNPKKGLIEKTHTILLSSGNEMIGADCVCVERVRSVSWILMLIYMNISFIQKKKSVLGNTISSQAQPLKYTQFFNQILKKKKHIMFVYISFIYKLYNLIIRNHDIIQSIIYL